MTHTFLVAIRFDDGADLTSEADGIREDLLNAGHDVESVTMWKAPTLTATQPIQPMFKSSVQHNNYD